MLSEVSTAMTLLVKLRIGALELTTQVFALTVVTECVSSIALGY
jgi:hypothetical protein